MGKREEVSRKTIETAVAVASVWYGDRKDLCAKVYEKLGEMVSGFPGIWTEVAAFAEALEDRFSALWDEGAREFIDDVDAATTSYMTECLDAGYFVDTKTFLAAWEASDEGKS
jgi:hypothetical protein